MATITHTHSDAVRAALENAQRHLALATTQGKKSWFASLEDAAFGGAWSCNVNRAVAESAAAEAVAMFSGVGA